MTVQCKPSSLYSSSLLSCPLTAGPEIYKETGEVIEKEGEKKRNDKMILSSGKSIVTFDLKKKIESEITATTVLVCHHHLRHKNARKENYILLLKCEKKTKVTEIMELTIMVMMMV